VEALVAFPTFFAFFTTIVQLCFLELAGLATQHAATLAARAAVVVAADDPGHYGGAPLGSLEGARRGEVEEAVTNALRFTVDRPEVKVSFSGGFGPGAIATATVDFDYRCWVPWGGLVACGPSRHLRLVREASMPSQTPRYEYP
jgi:hypothetical protein